MYAWYGVGELASDHAIYRLLAQTRQTLIFEGRTLLCLIDHEIAFLKLAIAQ